MRKLAYLAPILAVLVLAGCRHPGGAEVAQGQARNYFSLVSAVPSPVRRVVILPISTPEARPSDETGSAQLQPALGEELKRLGRFEVVEVSPAQMAHWTGRRSWRPEDVLPADFFEKLRASVDCDAVLFVHLQAYQPYKPLLLGWNLKLVEINTGYMLWAADEVFDAADPAVAKAAVRYGHGQVVGPGRLGAEDGVLLSPQRFAHYTLAAVFDTLPTR